MKRFFSSAALLLILTLFSASCSSGPAQELPPTSVPLSEFQTYGPDSDPGLNPPDYPITLPPGFGITVFARGLDDPTMLAFGPDGALYASQPQTGRIIRLPDRDGDGLADGAEIAAEDLIEPSGIAFFADGSMYVAETTRILRLEDPEGDGSYQQVSIVTAGIAAGGNTNRSLLFDPEWKHVYLAVGSSCNACREQDERRGTVMRFKPDGSRGRIFTRGLRNVFGLAFHPGTGILWAASMEREGLDDGLPPETVYSIYVEADAGWPFCHAGRIVDPDLGQRDSCHEDLLTPVFELESQTEPHGMEFYSGSQFPAEFQQDLFIALQGRGPVGQAAGYKIIRIPLGGGEKGPVQDFATGWLGEDGTPLGTPTDLVQSPDGDLFLSDRQNGIIYRIFYAE